MDIPHISIKGSGDNVSGYMVTLYLNISKNI